MAVWSAGQYVKFEDERTRPARDLLDHVPLAGARHVVDIGCGPGNSTELLVERFPDAKVVGLDSSPEMLAAARKRLPDVDFIEADIAAWRPSAPVDLLYANAVFQWVPGHEAVLARLLDGLPSGSVLALQMPDNLGEPTHLLMAEVAQSGPWADAYEGHDIARAILPVPARYYDLLEPFASRIDIWHTIYNHPLTDAVAIVEWVKGTGLRPWLDPLNEMQRRDYLAEYTRRIARAYPPLRDGKVLLRFPRLFIVATRR
ncbi:trans-aconitate 2-methyltransferase [Parvibaculum sp.]|uniref:trans-aconitate 2-methyltransferase n=1 Tax=Parvibaculum sp. TaxID=2024848 RepID=UPI00320FFB58